MLKRFIQLEEWFDNYTDGFRSDDPKIQRNFNLKIYHTKKVLENSIHISEALQLNDQDTYIAKASALLHDVGRFEQFKRYNTFVDKLSTDHAELGLEIIGKENPLVNFPKEVVAEIKTAIQFHNKLEVPTNIDEKSQFFTRLLRDADKIDIFRVVTEYYEQQKSGEYNEAIVLGLPDTADFSDEVIDDILNRQIVKSQDLKTINDFKLLQMAWVFDINFAISLKIIEKHKFVAQIYDSLPKNEKIKQANEIISEFIKVNCIKDSKSILF